MRQQVLKALANPPHIFYVPYSIAVLNFVVQFLIYVILLTVGMIVGGVTGGEFMNPLYFLLSVIIVHLILAGFSKKEPQLANIIAAKMQLFKRRVQNELRP